MRAAATRRSESSVLLPSKKIDAHTNDYSRAPRSEEHTSELQSRRDLVCRLLLEKKKKKKKKKKYEKNNKKKMKEKTKIKHKKKINMQKKNNSRSQSTYQYQKKSRD